ncbi:ATP-binding cassette domain-containing protein [Aneurinibacillus migulanus]|uniref:ABC transporter ATP-binding protein n=1 Tax=Aneurinibacillus migulanus TaxID=47500 RepID=UPI002E1B0D93|nr:ATP-binding cassette domain-containing protein [Aneurinibacillus migulanus]MED4731065.1 ATP-binding cassette domain-containing protein [Aneurinibacillus migulanus]
MAIIEVERLSFWYPDEERAALSDMSLTVKAGEFIVLCGASGCGKTTLLRHLKKELTPVGKRTGRIMYKGVPLEEQPDRQTTQQIGMVFQNPESQIVMDTVWHELAFSMENMGYTLPVMRKRLGEMTQFFGLEPLLYRSVHELSGGQKQMINLASVLLLQPNVLLLDEPTSQLDPVSAREFIQMVYRLNQEFSMTVIMSEHRLEDVIPLADRVIIMEKGQVKYAGSAGTVSRQIRAGQVDEELAYLPSIARLYFAVQPSANQLESIQQVPLTVREGKRWLAASRKEGVGVQPPAVSSMFALQEDELLTCREVTFQYGREQPEVLSKLSLSIYRGECLAILGGNGAGKSTLLQIMAGLAVPQRGSVRYRKKQDICSMPEKERARIIGYLAQNPLLYFSYDTVEEELLHMAEYAGISSSAEKIQHLLVSFGIIDIVKKHPHDISGGQQQKVALAMVLLADPHILLLDEPTKGMDPPAKKRMAALLHALREAGTTVVFVTHDIEFAARHATRCAMLFDGAISAVAEPRVFFSENYFYTTVINRIVREWLPDALTYEDVIKRWNVPVSLF